MNHFNYSIIEGNVSAKPTKETINNLVVVKLTIDNQHGVSKEIRTFNIRLTGKLGEIAFKQLDIGKRVLVSGTLSDKGYIEGKEVNFLSKD